MTEEERAEKAFKYLSPDKEYFVSALVEHKLTEIVVARSIAEAKYIFSQASLLQKSYWKQLMYIQFYTLDEEEDPVYEMDIDYNFDWEYDGLEMIEDVMLPLQNYYIEVMTNDKYIYQVSAIDSRQASELVTSRFLKSETDQLIYDEGIGYQFTKIINKTTGEVLLNKEQEYFDNYPKASDIPA